MRSWWSKVWMTLRRGRNPDAGVRHEPESRGDWGENTAADFLKRSGWKIEAVRHRVDRRNELDIVAWDGDTLVFVEVKTRRSERFGRPVESVHRAKRFHLSRAAVRYLSKRRAQPRYIRFDVMEVVGEPDNFRMEHLRNVFPLSTPYRPPPLLDRD